MQIGYRKGYKNKRRSTADFVFAINGTSIYCKSKRQTVVSLSLGEAGYVAILKCGKAVT